MSKWLVYVKKYENNYKFWVFNAIYSSSVATCKYLVLNELIDRNLF